MHAAAFCPDLQCGQDGKQNVAPCENVLMEIALSHVVNDVFNI